MTRIDPASLLQAARDVAANAHAPYSRFYVGAACLDESGRVHVGCNVENAAYPEGTCAEAGAISAMIAAGGKRIGAIAVAGLSAAPAPCGGCRQKISEFADPDAPVLMTGPDGVVNETTIGALLPGAFDATALEDTP